MLKRDLNNAMKALEKINCDAYKPAADDIAGTPAVNALKLGAKFEKLQREYKLASAYMDDIREATRKWSEVIIKADPEEQPDLEATADGHYRAIHLDTKLEDYADKLRGMKNLLEDLRVAKETQQLQANNAGGNAGGGATQQQSTAATTAMSLMALPTLRLRSFKGDRTEFPEFWENYETAINNNSSLNDVQKLTYLRTLLEEEPKELIQGLTLEPANYRIAVDMIRDRYGDSSERVRQLHLKLLALPTAKSLKDMRSLAIALDGIIRQLENQNQDVSGPQTYLVLERKLPKHALRKILDEKANNPAWNTEAFRRALWKIVKEEELLQAIVEEDKKPDKPASSKSKGAHQVSYGVFEHLRGSESSSRAAQNTAPNRPKVKRDVRRTPAIPKNSQQRGRGVINASSAGGLAPKYPCPLCGPGATEQAKMCMHWSKDCRKYSTAKARSDRAKELRLCYKCLRSGHGSRECKSRPHELYLL